jgi:Fe-S cluster assembly iron-binding protein IscA
MISITTAAQQRLEQVVGTESSTARLVRVAVVRGSHGWVHSWRLEIEDSAQPDDVELGFGRLGVLIESDLIDTLDEATIDYREDGGAIGFTIETPDTRAPDGTGSGCGHQ